MQVFVYEIDITPGTMDEAIQEYYDTILPVLQQHQLYVDSDVLIDRENNRAVYVGKYQLDPPGYAGDHASYARDLGEKLVNTQQGSAGLLRRFELLQPPPNPAPGD